MPKNRTLLLSMTALCLTLVCAFLFTGHVEASPAAPIDLTLTQPDGTTTFTARQWGDEWNNGIETVEGYSILQQSDGWWVYAEAQADGLLGPALVESNPRRVGIDSPEGLPLHLRPTNLTVNPNAASVMFADGVESPEYQNIGTQNVLVLLVEYSNQPHDTNSTVTYFQSLWFGATGSIKEYYLETSYNNLTLAAASESFDTNGDGVVGWVNLGPTHPASDGTLSNNEMRQIAKDAVTVANPYIDYASFDTNPADGYISQKELHIFVIVAGYETSYDLTYTNAVWAHNWSLEGIGYPTLDGVVIGYSSHDGGYSEVGELHGTHQATMGVMAHELGHDLSNPDLYDVDESSNGVGEWSVMGYGSWGATSGYAGSKPVHYDAFLKSYMGWLTPTNVSGTLTDQMILQSETNAVAYRLRPNSGNVDWEFYHHSGTGEYFLVENRQQTGYDAGLPNCGLLIWHIDESVTSTNSANANENHALVWLEQADGLNELAGITDYGDAGDPWPGSSARYTFNYASTPNNRLYSGLTSSTAVHVDSTSCGSSMQADLTYPTVDVYLPLIMKPSVPWTTIMTEDFEGSFPSGWTVADKWSYDGFQAYPARRDCKPYAGSYSGWMVGGGAQGSGLGCGAYYPNDAEAWMIYGPFSTVGLSAGQLNFYHWTKTYNSNDRFCVWASSDNNYYNGWCFWGNWSYWSSYSLDLSDANYNNYLGLSSVWVAFTLQTSSIYNTNDGAYVDNIVLRKCTSGTCTGSPPLFSVGGNLLDELSYFLDPFVVQFSFPASGVLGEK